MRASSRAAPRFCVIGAAQEMPVKDKLASDMPAMSLPRAEGPMDRVRWADYARGIAIALVVCVHCIGGLLNTGTLPQGGAFQLIVKWMFTFMLQVFFFLAGLFGARKAERSFSRTLRDKLQSIAYPYLVWAVLQTGLQIVLSQYTNFRKTPVELLRIPFDPPDQFWFLYALFVIALIHAILASMRVGPLGILAVSVGLYLLVRGQMLGSFRPLNLAATSAIYYAIGVWAAGAQALKTFRRMDAAALVAIAVVGYAIPAIAVGLHRSEGVLQRPLLGLAGICATLAVSFLCERAAVARFLERWGVSSLEIYLAHVLLAAAARVVLQRAFGAHRFVAAQLGITIAVGIYGPLMIQWICARVGFRYLFSLRPRYLAPGQG